MRRNLSFFGYLAVFAVIAAVALSGPTAWATPEQSNLNQTVPTRTPQPPPRPTDSDPGEPEPPPDTPAPPGATVTPGGPTPLPATVVVPAAGPRLVLEKRADRDHVWPGVTVLYTLTLSNVGAAAARQVVIQDLLPPGLEPGVIVSGSGVAWDQRTLRAQLPALQPGGKYTISFTAVVTANADSSPVLLNEAMASAAGGLIARTRAMVALPPVELPPVGGGQVGSARGEGAGR